MFFSHMAVTMLYKQWLLLPVLKIIKWNLICKKTLVGMIKFESNQLKVHISFRILRLLKNFSRLFTEPNFEKSVTDTTDFCNQNRLQNLSESCRIPQNLSEFLKLSKVSLGLHIFCLAFNQGRTALVIPNLLSNCLCIIKVLECHHLAAKSTKL